MKLQSTPESPERLAPTLDEEENPTQDQPNPKITPETNKNYGERIPGPNPCPENTGDKSEALPEDNTKAGKPEEIARPDLTVEIINEPVRILDDDDVKAGIQPEDVNLQEHTGKIKLEPSRTIVEDDTKAGIKQEEETPKTRLEK